MTPLLRLAALCLIGLALSACGSRPARKAPPVQRPAERAADDAERAARKGGCQGRQGPKAVFAANDATPARVRAGQEVVHRVLIQPCASGGSTGGSSDSTGGIDLDQATLTRRVLLRGQLVKEFVSRPKPLASGQWQDRWAIGFPTQGRPGSYRIESVVEFPGGQIRQAIDVSVDAARP